MAVVGCGGCLVVSLCVAPVVMFGVDGGVGESFGSPFESSDENHGDPSADFPAESSAPALPGGTDGRTIEVRVTHVSGLSSIELGQHCRFEVMRHTRPDRTFWCNAQIRCADELLYGGPSAGFFDCTLYDQPERHVVGEDRETSASDQSPAMLLDTLASELVIHDDASGQLGEIRVQAEVLSVL